MTVRLVGEGPALEAVRAALADADVAVEDGDPASLADADLGVVAAPAGDELLDSATEHADRWMAIELGGVGGRAVGDVEAAVSGFAPGAGCYRCLQQRVAANAGGEDGASSDSADATGGGAIEDVDASTARFAGAVAGRELARALAGDDRITGTVVELPHARRQLLPVPGCTCATDDGSAPLAAARSLPIPREHAERSVEETVGRMDRTIDERLGIVGQIGEASSFPAPYYLATLAETTPFSDGDAPDKAAGVDDDWNAALVKAVGESLERYAAAVYREEAFEHVAPAELSNVVPPAAFPGAPEDAPGADATESLPWVEAEVLTGGEPDGGDGVDDGDDRAPDRAWLPASAVHFPPPEARSVPGITTGLGLGSSPVGALVSGLTEVVERDAAMLAWYSTFEPLGLAVDDPDFERLARRARGEGLTVTPLLVTQDVDVPVVSVALHREGEWPQFAVAADAALDPIEAATGALCEALQNWMELRSTGRDAAGDLSGAIGEYAAFTELAREFVDVERTVPAAEVGPAEPATGAEAVPVLVEALSAAGLDAYAARLTTRDIASLGFEAVRVVAPEAQPLFTDSPRFADRARRVPDELGFEPRLDRAHHPYP